MSRYINVFDVEVKVPVYAFGWRMYHRHDVKLLIKRKNDKDLIIALLFFIFILPIILLAPLLIGLIYKEKGIETYYNALYILSFLILTPIYILYLLKKYPNPKRIIPIDADKELKRQFYAIQFLAMWKYDKITPILFIIMPLPLTLLFSVTTFVPEMGIKRLAFFTFAILFALSLPTSKHFAISFILWNFCRKKFNATIEDYQCPEEVISEYK